MPRKTWEEQNGRSDRIANRRPSDRKMPGGEALPRQSPRSVRTRNRISSTVRAMLSAREFGIFAFLIVMSTAIGLARPSFFGTGNLLAMGRQMAELTIMGVAMTFLITAQELDL